MFTIVRGENAPGMRPHSCQLYSRMRSPGHVTSEEGLQRSVPDNTRLLVTMEDVSPAPDIPGLWASRPGPASPADDNNYCYKPIKDLFKDFFEQLLVLFIIISRAKRNHYSWKWCTLEAVFALCSLLSASNRKCMAIKSTVLEINVCIRQK